MPDEAVKAKKKKEIKIAEPLRPLADFPDNQIFSLKEAIPYMKTTEQTFYNTPSKQRFFTKNESNYWVITVKNLKKWVAGDKL